MADSFLPSWVAALAITTTSSDVVVPMASSLLLENDGNVVCFVRFGNVIQVATANDLPILPGGRLVISPGQSTHVAAICGSGGTVLRVVGGVGRVLGIGGGASAASAAISPPLDVVPGAAAGYSFRRLRAVYAGSAAQVQRSSDSTVQDIGFSGNDFAAGAFVAFVGGGTGSVAKWYDQSGNGNDAVQATGANQPGVVGAGGAVYAAQAVGSSGQRVVAGDAASIRDIWSGGGYVALVTKPTRGGTGDGAWLSKGSGPNGWVLYSHQIADHQIIMYVKGGTTDAVYHTNDVVSATQPSVITFAWNSSVPATPAVVTLNGVACSYSFQQAPVGAVGSDVGNPAVIDNDFLLGTGANAMDGNIYEVLLYKGIPSAGSQTSLVNNLRAYYGTA